MDDIEDFTELPGEPRDEGLVVSKRARASRQLPRGEEEGSGVIPGAGRTIYVKSYGCGHNTSDGEVMAGLLHRAGYNVTDKLDTERIDAFLINSCTVKNPSESSFRSLVTECKQRGGQVVVTGCVPQGDAKKAEEQWGDVSVIGVQQIERVVEVVEEALRVRDTGKMWVLLIDSIVQRVIACICWDVPRRTSRVSTCPRFGEISLWRLFQSIWAVWAPARIARRYMPAGH